MVRMLYFETTSGDKAANGECSYSGDNISCARAVSPPPANAFLARQRNTHAAGDGETLARPEHLQTGPALLDLWSTKVRRHILVSELLSGAIYDEGNNSCAVQFHNRNRSDIQTLVHLIRPSERDFERQLNWVWRYAGLRSERGAEIDAQSTDALALLGSAASLHPDRHCRTIELLSLVLHVTTILEMRVKHSLACRRPVEYSPHIQPTIETPDHGSLPGGHATEAFAVAFILYALMRRNTNGDGEIDDADPAFIKLLRYAERIAVNRTVAGVQFPADNAAGMVLGHTLAEFYIARFSGAGKVWTRGFDGSHFDGDFGYEEVLSMACDKPAHSPGQPCGIGTGKCITRSSSPVRVPVSPLLQHLWYDALEEWSPSGVGNGGDGQQ